MYADDLLLLSASLCDLQSMIDCCVELDKLDMKLNVKKSQLVRTGRSHNKAVHGVLLNGRPIACVNELKYLGWYILSAKSLKLACILCAFAFSSALTRYMLRVIVSVSL